jgi:LEA14-like dessication related protein
MKSPLPPFLLVLLLLAACKSPVKEPEFVAARNFRVGKLGLKQTSVFMTLDYINPNPIGLTLENADLEVYLEGRYVGRTTLDSTIRIPAKDTFSIPVKLDVDMKNALPNLFKAGFNGEVEMVLKGNARFKKAGVPINLPVDYKGRHKFL